MAARKASCSCGKLSVTYDGPDPERISLCQCYECQKVTGSVMSVQTRLPREQDDRRRIERVDVSREREAAGHIPLLRQRGGPTYHFCPECGSTVYADLAIAPDFLLVHVGNFTDPTFPPPIVSGFEAYGHPCAKNTGSELPMPGGHNDYDGTSHGGPRL